MNWEICTFNSFVISLEMYMSPRWEQSWHVPCKQRAGRHHKIGCGAAMSEELVCPVNRSEKRLYHLCSLAETGMRSCCRMPAACWQVRWTCLLLHLVGWWISDARSHSASSSNSTWLSFWNWTSTTMALWVLLEKDKLHVQYFWGKHRKSSHSGRLIAESGHERIFFR